MKFLSCILFFIGLAILDNTSADTITPAELLKEGVPSPVKIECMLTKCPISATDCIADKMCREVAACANDCWSKWDEDTTSEKYHVQNCTNTCAFSYRDPAYLKFMTCVGDNQCLDFPPIPSQCKAPGNISILKQLSTADLSGSWGAVGGRHPVYDCYPCQHLSFEQLNDTTWKYLPTYQVYLANGSLATMNEFYYIPNSQPGSPISFVYHDTGLYHNETWYLVDGAEDGSYILQYYCGNTLEWYYDGFLILSRNETLSLTIMSTVMDTIKRATGLDTSTFCAPQTVGCTTAKKLYN